MEPVTMDIAVINADGSNRHESLQSEKRNDSTKLLCDYLYQKVKNNLPSTSAYALIITEFNKTCAEKLYGELPESVDWYGCRFTYSADYTATYWNEIGWHGEYKDGKKLDYIDSLQGKYCAVVLEHEEANQRVMYVSVHLPRTETKRKTAVDCLKELFEDAHTEKYNVDHIVIAGDFNMEPGVIENSFGSDFRVGLKGQKTTKAGNLIDNVVTTKGVEVKIEPQIPQDKDQEKLTHYPLFGSLTFNKQS